MNSVDTFFSDRRIVITGLGTINPLANDVHSYWKALKEGQSGLRVLQNIQPSDDEKRIGGEVDLPENVRDYFDRPKMIKRLDPCIVFGHIAGIQALQDSGLNTEKIAERCGTIYGSGAGGIFTHTTNIFRMHEQKYHEVSPFYLISAIPSTVAASFAKQANLKGPIFSVNSACASGNHAFGISMMLIKAGMADVMFAGGTEAAVNIPGLTAFGAISALSTRMDDPEHASRPFDADRDGILLSEGAGVLCLEALDHAKARGAKIYGEITGFAFTSDAHDMVAPHPEAEGAVRAIQGALKCANLRPEDIGLVNAHGTSTVLGDRIEALAINTAMGSYGSKVAVHSTKSMIGHLLGAASAVEAIAALMVFEEGVVHRTANHENLDPEIHLNVLSTNQDGKHIDHILSNSFGFGGMNASVVFSRFKEE